MKKIKYLPTRKKKAVIRWSIVIALVLLALFISPFHFLPSQSLRYFEDDRMTGRTKIIDRQFSVPLKIPGVQLATLSENENAVVYCIHTYNLITGWYPHAGTEADCSEAGKAVYASRLFASSSQTESSGAVFIGRIMDDAIDRVEIVADFAKYAWLHPDATPENRVIASQDGFARKDGPETFCLSVHFGEDFPRNEEGQRCSFESVIRCYDAAGALLYCEEIKDGWAASLG